MRGPRAAGQAQDALGGPAEAGAETDGHVNQAGVVGVLEDGADPLDFVAERHRTPAPRQGRPQPGEVVAAQVADGAVPAEGRGDPLAGAVVVRPGPGRDLAGVNQVSLGGQEVVEHVADLHLAADRARPQAGVQVVLLLQVLLEGRLGVDPRAEVVQSAADFLGPAACGVGEEREIGVGLGGLALTAGAGRLGRSGCSLVALARALGR